MPMHNAECEMQNEGVRTAYDRISMPAEHTSILHFEFCMLGILKEV